MGGKLDQLLSRLRSKEERKRLVNRLVYFLWPPYEAKLADKAIDARMDDAHRQAILRDIYTSIPENVDGEEYKDLEHIAMNLEESESSREKSVEDKALFFFSAIGVVVGLLALFSRVVPSSRFPGWVVTSLSIGYLVAAIYLFTASYYAWRARRISQLEYFSADSFLHVLKKGRWKIRDRIVFAICRVKRNEDRILRKTNYVVVTEGMFFRGLVLLLLFVFINLTIGLIL